MEFGRVWVLRGPNLWAPFPVIGAEVELGEFDSYRPGGPESAFTRALPEALRIDLPPGATLADALLRLTQRFQSLAGAETSFGLVHKTRRPAFFRVVFGYDGEE